MSVVSGSLGSSGVSGSVSGSQGVLSLGVDGLRRLFAQEDALFGSLEGEMVSLGDALCVGGIGRVGVLERSSALGCVMVRYRVRLNASLGLVRGVLGGGMVVGEGVRSLCRLREQSLLLRVQRLSDLREDLRVLGRLSFSVWG